VSNNPVLLDKLDITKALHLLNKTAYTTKGQHLEDIMIAIDNSKETEDGCIVLVVPARMHPVGREKIFEAYRNIAGKEVDRRGKPSGKLMPLAEGVPWLLLKSSSVDKEFQTEDSVQDTVSQTKKDYLIVERKLRHQQVIKICKYLQLLTIDPHVAVSEVEGDTFYLFHVLDDPTRHSAFSSLLVGNILTEECQVLNSFSHRGLSVFLERGITPDSKAMSYFYDLLHNMPQLFGIKSVETDGDLLAAVVRWPVEQQPADQWPAQVLYLSNLTFQSCAGLIRPVTLKAGLGVYHLTDSPQALAQLDETLQKAAPNIGYRLNLQPVRYPQDDPEHLETRCRHVKEKLADLEYELFLLESVLQNKNRPQLFRFTQEQLPVLAETLRSFHPPVIPDQSLKYGFHAPDNDPNNPAGVHFLFLEKPSQTPQSRLIPGLLSPDFNISPMQFWLDPYWAHDYYRKEDEYYQEEDGYLIFVPKGTALLPPLHSWDVRYMNNYLRQMVGSWFGPNTNLPAKPIYIFDGQVGPKKQIELIVLDWANLQSLYTRLSWLNHNLTIMNRVGLEDFISRMADEITRQDLANQLIPKAEQAQKEFEEVAAQTKNKVSQITTGLTETITQEFEAIFKETRQNIEKIRSLNQRLQNIVEANKKMDKLVTSVGDDRTRAWQVAKEVQQTIDKLQKALENLKQDRQKLEEVVPQEIKSLEEWINNLEEGLQELEDKRKKR